MHAAITTAIIIIAVALVGFVALFYFARDNGTEEIEVKEEKKVEEVKVEPEVKKATAPKKTTKTTTSKKTTTKKSGK